MRPAFTLLELLVVVLLLGLAAALVGLRLQAHGDAAQLRSAALGLEQALRTARHEARVRQQAAALELQLGTGRYRIRHVDGSGVWRSLSAVTLAAARVGDGPVLTDRIESIRVTPTGATLPWAVEMRAGTSRRTVWSDGVTGRVGVLEDVALDTFRWPETGP